MNQYVICIRTDSDFETLDNYVKEILKASFYSFR